MSSYAASVGGRIVAGVFLAFMAAAPSPAADLNNVMNAVVRLQTAESEGVGVVAGKSDETVFIITAKHVVESQPNVSVFFNAARHKKHAGHVIHMSDEVDLAVVAVDLPAGDVRKSLRPIEIHDGHLARLAVVSNISHTPDPWEMNAGVNKLQGEQVNTLTFSKLGVLEGASGGPLLDSENRLAGLVTVVDGTKATALKINVVMDALRIWNVRTNNLGVSVGEPKVLLTDHFDDNRNNWYVSSDRKSPAGVEQGRYKLGSTSNAWRFTTIPVSLEPSRPFRISVKVTKLRGADDYFYGLMWGVRDSEHFYNLAITSSGHVAVTAKDNGQFTNFNEPAYVDPNVKQGNDVTNVLTVARVDDNLQFQINGSTVHEMSFRPFFGTFIGFLAYQDVHVAFDDLEVVGVPKAVASAPPSASVPEPKTEDALSRIARESDAQILQMGGALSGTIAANATIACAFSGTHNSPIVFTLGRSTPKPFRAKLEILNSHGLTVLKDQNFSLRTVSFSFVPPKDDVFLLRITGTHGFGGFTVEMSPLTPPS